MIDLSKSEKEVMSVIFTKEEEMRLKDIVDAVNQKFEHSWKPQTVSTFLARMIKKNYLTTYRKGRYTFYTLAQKHKGFCKVVYCESIYRYFNRCIKIRVYNCI